MSVEEQDLPTRQNLLTRAKQFMEWLLALKVTEQERFRFADDPLNVFGEDVSNRRPLQVAAVLAILFHLMLLFLSLPFLHSQVLLPSLRGTSSRERFARLSAVGHSRRAH